MSFQPFGYRFEVFSSLSLAEAKIAIRSKKTSIFDVKNGARGWVVGPFVCLWFSAFDRYGPMLFGMISADKFGTRVHGRAGSDLDGIATYTALIPLMAWIVFMMISEGQATGGQLVMIAVVFLIGGPLIYWLAHKQRKDAEPLVRFLRKALTQSASRYKSTASPHKTGDEMRLLLNGDDLEGPVSQEAIQNALIRVGNRDFMIIEAGPQDYMQTMCEKGKYILEVRKGGRDKHYRAVRNQTLSTDHSKSDDTFTFEEVSEAIASYVADVPLPSFLRLQPMDVH